MVGKNCDQEIRDMYLKIFQNAREIALKDFAFEIHIKDTYWFKDYKINRNQLVEIFPIKRMRFFCELERFKIDSSTTIKVLEQ